VLEGLIIVEMYNYMYIVHAFCNNIETSIVYKSYITEQWRNVDPVVEYPTTDSLVMGSTPGGAEIGLHVFHKPHNDHEYQFTKEANIESC
jgi:hypothetical protein